MLLVDLDALNMLLLGKASRGYGRRICADLQNALQLGLDPGPDKNHTLDEMMGQLAAVLSWGAIVEQIRGGIVCANQRSGTYVRFSQICTHGASKWVRPSTELLVELTCGGCPWQVFVLSVVCLRGTKEYFSSVKGRNRDRRFGFWC